MRSQMYDDAWLTYRRDILSNLKRAVEVIGKGPRKHDPIAYDIVTLAIRATRAARP